MDKAEGVKGLKPQARLERRGMEYGTLEGEDMIN
jgi:hypothetical protein